MSSAEYGGERVRSIKSLRAVFEQRADLDAFWLASVDFSKERGGVSTQLLQRGDSSLQQTFSLSTPLARTKSPSSSSTKKLPDVLEGEVHEDNGSWRNHQLDGSLLVKLHSASASSQWNPLSKPLKDVGYL